MSDKQKGLIPAFEEVLPMVSHRFCVRHLHANMKVAGFGGMAVRDALWKAARATTVPTFSQAMRELKTLDVQAFAWLGNKHPSTWSRSHFSTDVKSDVLVNNLCECFNAMILDARDSPLIHCLEIVRKQIMMRLFACRQQALKWNSKLCPNIAKKLEVIEEQAGGYWGIQSTVVLFEVKGAYDQHQVDLYAKTCSCRKWDLTGIPCRHVICVLWLKYGKAQLYDFVDQCYTVDTYLKAYSGAIHPMAGPKEWPETDREPPLPPLFTTKIGRPRKMRKKSAVEPTKNGIHMSRQHVRLHCSICKQRGHNSRRCQRREQPQHEVVREEPLPEMPREEPPPPPEIPRQDLPTEVHAQAEEIPHGELGSVPIELQVVGDGSQQPFEWEVPVDPLISVGDSINLSFGDVIFKQGLEGIRVDNNQQQGLKPTSYYGSPAKRRKIPTNASKGKAVVTTSSAPHTMPAPTLSATQTKTAPTTKSKGKKSMGLTRSRKYNLR